MRVLLIDPPFRRFTGFANMYFPLGLGYLANVLREDGFDVKILDVDVIQRTKDLDLTDEYYRLQLYVEGLRDETHAVWEDVRNILVDYEPDVIGITAMTMKFGSVLRTAEICKKTLPDCKIIVGGPHATLDPAQTLKSPHIDFAVRGEGENTLSNLLSALNNTGDLTKINGVSFKDNSGIMHNQPEKYIQNLDRVGLPARDLLMYKENYSTEDMGVIMSSRGCPFNCSYCFHMWERKIRNHSIDYIINELKHVKDTYGTRQFEFKDDTFTLNRRRVISLCKSILNEKLNINWGCTTRADTIDDELLKVMRKAGCNVIKIGVESGSEKILRETKKGTTLDQIRKAANLLNTNHMFWSAYFMIGLPNETEEDILATHEFMKELDPYYAGLGVYSPFPNTELFNLGVEMDLIQPNVELEHFFTTNPKDYYFKDPRRRLAYIEPERFDKLLRFMSNSFHKHNTRLTNMAHRGWARKMAYINDFKLFLGDFRKVQSWIGLAPKHQKIIKK